MSVVSADRLSFLQRLSPQEGCPGTKVVSVFWLSGGKNVSETPNVELLHFHFLPDRSFCSPNVERNTHVRL